MNNSEWFDEIAKWGVGLDMVDEIMSDWELSETKLNNRIAEMEAELRWIPVSESLPKCGEDVLFTDGEDVYSGYHIIKMLRWASSGDIFWYDTRYNLITHWRAKPKLPEVNLGPVS